jgi:hypothetical protein
MTSSDETSSIARFEKSPVDNTCNGKQPSPTEVLHL